MTAHKHAAMIKAKADNMDLVVFRKNYDDEWLEMSNHGEIAIKQNGEYFLCLPRHKEACLHWLSGGKIQYKTNLTPVWRDYQPSINFGLGSVFMQYDFFIRPKPRKEKRWIGFNKHTAITTSTLYKSIDDIKGATVRHEEWQFIEIEVEI